MRSFIGVLLGMGLFVFLIGSGGDVAAVPAFQQTEMIANPDFDTDTDNWFVVDWDSPCDGQLGWLSQSVYPNTSNFGLLTTSEDCAGVWHAVASDEFDVTNSVDEPYSFTVTGYANTGGTIDYYLVMNGDVVEYGTISALPGWIEISETGVIPVGISVFSYVQFDYNLSGSSPGDYWLDSVSVQIGEPEPTPTETPTPTDTPEPTETPTPGPTPEPSPTPALTDIASYTIDLPSGGAGRVLMTMTAGEFAIAAAFVVLCFLVLFDLLRKVVYGARHK